MQSGQSPLPFGDEPHAALQADEGVAHLTQWCSSSPGVLGASKASREIQTRPQLTNLKYQKIKSLGLVDDLVF